jgi:PPE-repeat protein
MTATAARCMGWLQSTAEQAKRTARTAAAAYEHAYAMRVAVSSAYYMEALPTG